MCQRVKRNRLISPNLVLGQTLIITTGSFTADARREATRDGAPAIDLVDGELLCELLKERRLGVVVREVRAEEVSVDRAFLSTI
jgi:restriction system protein